MSKLHFNYARREINPPFKMGLAGYFNTRIWTKIRDTLEVRVAAFRNGKDLALLIQYDLIACPPPMFAMLKEELRREGIPAVLCVTATHCHTAPEVRIGRGGYEEKYLPFAVARTMEAVGEALSGMTPGTLRSGMSSEGRCCFNRRFWMRDGSVWSNPGKLNPDILRPEGEIDPEIPLLEFTSSDGKTLLLAGICNHADTTGGNEVSGDWPGWTRRLSEEKLGTGSMVMPVIGCSGDINHFDVRDPRPQTSPEEAERIAPILGCSAATLLQKAGVGGFSAAAAPELEAGESKGGYRAERRIPLLDLCDLDSYDGTSPVMEFASRHAVRGVEAPGLMVPELFAVQASGRELALGLPGMLMLVLAPERPEGFRKLDLCRGADGRYLLCEPRRGGGEKEFRLAGTRRGIGEVLWRIPVLRVSSGAISSQRSRETLSNNPKSRSTSRGS